MKKVKLDELSPKEQELVEAAKQVREKAYTPYSKHKVGAAVLSASNKIYVGCNVERVTLSQSTHAERNAIDTMAACGERKLLALCCFGKYSGIPCAECRQVIWEFACENVNVKIIGATLEGEIYVTTIGDLYPYPYGPESKGVDPCKFV